MSAVLPLFGSWVATVLAYYFARENLNAATTSVSALVGTQRKLGLDNIPVTYKMIERSRIIALSDQFPAIQDAQLKDVASYMKDRAVRRSPVLDDRGAITHMVHLSTIDQYIRDQVATGKALDGLKFADLLGVPALKIVLEQSFEIVGEGSTLHDVKEKMRQNPICEEVFVTRTGVADEPVLGWITDNAVLSVEA